MTIAPRQWMLEEITMGAYLFFIVATGIWFAWDEAVRLLAIAVLAVAYTHLFRPREPKR